MSEIFLLCAVGALLMLDNSAAFQILISQPMFASAILGWLGNDITLGLQLGFLLQLVWLSNMPVGAAIVPEGNFGSIAATIFALSAVQQFSEYENFIVFLSIAFALLCSFVGAKMVTFIRHWNQRLLQKLFKKLADNQAVRLGGVITLSLLFNALVVFVFLLVLVLVALELLESVIPFVPIDVNKIGHYAQVAILGAGLGLTLTLFREKRLRALYLIGLALGGVVLLV